MDSEVVSLDNSNGDLTLRTPNGINDVLNITANVSCAIFREPVEPNPPSLVKKKHTQPHACRLACATQLARGTREWSDISRCVGTAIDLLWLQNAKVWLWPQKFMRFLRL